MNSSHKVSRKFCKPKRKSTSGGPADDETETPELSLTEASQNEASITEAYSQQETDNILNASGASDVNISSGNDLMLDGNPESSGSKSGALNGETSDCPQGDQVSNLDVSNGTADVSSIAGQGNVQIEPAVAVDEVGAQG